MKVRKVVNGKTCSFALSGKFTFADHQSYRQIIDDIKSKNFQVVNLDFKEVEFLDSAALGMILLSREEANKNEVELVLLSPVGHVQKMFQLSDFYSMFNIK